MVIGRPNIGLNATVASKSDIFDRDMRVIFTWWSTLSVTGTVRLSIFTCNTGVGFIPLA